MKFSQPSLTQKPIVQPSFTQNPSLSNETEMIEKETEDNIHHEFQNLSKKQVYEMLDVFKTIKFDDMDREAFWNYYQNFELNIDKIYRSSLSPESIAKIDSHIGVAHGA